MKYKTTDDRVFANIKEARKHATRLMAGANDENRDIVGTIFQAEKAVGEGIMWTPKE